MSEIDTEKTNSAGATMSRPRIVVIAGTKASDALLCQSLEAVGFQLRIVHYKIHLSYWIPWVWKRIVERGPITFLGHLLLAFWLRMERVGERLRRKSLWNVVHQHTPSWGTVCSERQFCWSEKSLAVAVQDADFVLCLDAFRFSHRMFRSIKKDFLQVVWGDVPDYMGDSGGFWAYYRGDPVCVSVVMRGNQFDKITVIKKFTVEVSDRETVRTIKIKQAALLATTLPELFRNFSKEVSVGPNRDSSCRFFYAPTLWTYLTASRSRDRAFPGYAYRSGRCMVGEVSLPI